MKNTFALFLAAGMATWGLSSFSFYPNDQHIQSQKLSHIKITKIENENKMELDTTLLGDDLFVWNGDTVNSDKVNKKFNPSRFDKIHYPDGGKNLHKKIKIYQYGAGKDGDSTRWQSDPNKDVEIFSQDASDSAQKKIILRKRLKDGTVDDRIIYLNGPKGENFLTMPPMPPMPPMNFKRSNHPERIIDLNDPNIIFFRKKKMRGDREKIVIIRKKLKHSDNMNFDFQMDDAMALPESPEPPVFDNKFNIDDSLKKEIRKEIRVEIKNDSLLEKDLIPKVNK